MAISMQIIYTYAANILTTTKGYCAQYQDIFMSVTMATLWATTLQTVFAPRGQIATALKTNFPKV